MFRFGGLEASDFWEFLRMPSSRNSAFFPNVSLFSRQRVFPDAAMSDNHQKIPKNRRRASETGAGFPEAQNDGFWPLAGGTFISLLGKIVGYTQRELVFGILRLHIRNRFYFSSFGSLSGISDRRKK
jgi:hypothetical protein